MTMKLADEIEKLPPDCDSIPLFIGDYQFRDFTVGDLRAALRREEGVWVPREPTPAMCLAGFDAVKNIPKGRTRRHHTRGIYKAMLSVAEQESKDKCDKGPPDAVGLADYPTIERLSDLTVTTVGYQGPVLVEEAVRCLRALKVAAQRLREMEGREDELLDKMDEYWKQIQSAERRVAELGWISVGDRLPKIGDPTYDGPCDGTKVLFLHDGDVYSGWPVNPPDEWEMSESGMGIFTGVTHWMPLPKPPIAEQESK